MTRLPLALLVSCSLLAGCGDDAGTTIDPTAAAGESVYAVACIECHAVGGEGIEGMGEPLVDSDFIQSRTDQELFEVIVRGMGANDPENSSGVAMPPRAGLPDLSDAEIRAVIAYLRALQSPAD